MAKHLEQVNSRKWLKLGFYLLTIPLLIAVLFIFFSYSKKPAEKKAVPAIKINKVKDVSFIGSNRQAVNILLLGSDSRSESVEGLSDAIMVVHLDLKDNSATLISFPRDSRVPIPGHGTNKINLAFFSGGPDLTIQTIEELTGIDIHYYAITTFSGFTRIIDNLGGVQITLDQSIRDRWSGADFPAGDQKLTGEQALAFCRARHIPGGDLGRAAHHQDLLFSVFEQEKQKNEPQHLFKLVDILVHNCETNLSFKEIFELAKIAVQVQPDRITKTVLPGKTSDIKGGSYVILDQNQLTQTFEKIKNSDD